MSRAPSEFSAVSSGPVDRDALAAHACRLLPLLRAYVRLHSDPMLRARESCSDMVQSVFGECLADLDEFEYRNEPAFRKWLFQKAQSKILMRRRYWLAQRRDPRRETPISSDRLRASLDSASQVAIRNEELEALEACFDELSTEHREVIVAARLLGQSHAEIASELGKSEGAVRMLLNRALARLGTRLSDTTE